MKKTVFLLVAAVLLVSHGVRAAYLDPMSWMGGGVYFVDDAVDDVVNPHRDIDSLWYRELDDVHYFRMDLFAAPLLTDPVDYMILIDSDQNPGTGAAHFNDPAPFVQAPSGTSQYIPDGAVGIDQIVDMHWNFGIGAQHYHAYADQLTLFNYTFDTLAVHSGLFQNTENGGITLEWSLPVAELPTGLISIYGGTESIAGSGTYDLTEGIHTPEPGALGMVGVLALLGAGFALRRRRKA